jgi:hypothetical protein
LDPENKGVKKEMVYFFAKQIESKPAIKAHENAKLSPQPSLVGMNH